MDIKTKLAIKMMEYYAQNPPMDEQIIHTQRVQNFTEMIARGENFDESWVNVLEIAAILHDIGCPNSRRKYGNSLPKHQQDEGRIIADEWLKDADELSENERHCIADIVGSHHIMKEADRMNFRPLFEADLIVNLFEGYYKLENAQNLYDVQMKTETGRALFRTFFGDKLTLGSL